MKARRTAYGGDKGDAPDWGWDGTYGEYVGNYESLREQIQQQLKNCARVLEESVKMEIKNLKEISGAIVGFPAELPVAAYLANINAMTLQVQERLDRIDKYLLDQRKR